MDRPATHRAIALAANIYTDGVPDIVARFEDLAIEPLAPGKPC